MKMFTSLFSKYIQMHKKAHGISCKISKKNYINLLTYVATHQN